MPRKKVDAVTKVDIWMPTYISDKIANTGDMTGDQYRAFDLIEMHQWRHGPMTMEQMENLSRLHGNAWSVLQALLKRSLSIDENGLFFFRSVRERREEWLGRRIKAQLRASKGGIAAGEKRKREDEAKKNGNASSVPQAPPKAPINTPEGVLRELPSPAPLGTSTKASTNGTSSLTPGGGRRIADGTSRPAPIAAPRSRAPGPAVGADRRPRSGSAPAPSRPKVEKPRSASGKGSGVGKGAFGAKNASTVPLKSIASVVTKRGNPPQRPSAPDPRHSQFRDEIFAYHASVRSTLPQPGIVPKQPAWGPRERHQVSVLIETIPDVSIEMLRGWLMNRAQSEGVRHFDSPYLWIPTLLSYASGALDRFKKLKLGR